MTTLFISHGAPTLAIEPGATGKLLGELALSLPRPQAILVISAHWDTHAPRISLAEKPQTIHDFGGFPREMYEIEYPVNGAPVLAEQTATLLKKAGIDVELDHGRGLDHGAWVPLRLMYPDADIPVTQLSIQSRLGPQAHYDMGRAISQLQDENVLILCSGAITHNLHDLFTMQRDAKVLDYVPDFAEWVANKIEHEDTTALINYRKEIKSGLRAHPTEDHILPLFVALGAAKGKATRYQPENTYGILAMDIYRWD